MFLIESQEPLVASLLLVAMPFAPSSIVVDEFAKGNVAEYFGLAGPVADGSMVLGKLGWTVGNQMSDIHGRPDAT